MHNPEDTDATEQRQEKRRMVPDGIASLDDSDAEPIPRVRGLIELLNQYFGKKQHGGEPE